MGFLEDFEGVLQRDCYQNELPFCGAACPFNLDCKDIIAKIEKDRYNAAYRSFCNTVGFPAIVAATCDAPCERACFRNRKDAAVRLNALERTVLAQAKKKLPNAYNMPQRTERVAIVGGGISGLGCALFLCNKKYNVTIFEKSDHLGGALRERMDPAAFDEEIRNQFQYETYTLRLNTEITDLAPLCREYDAVYVATGAGGFDFQLTASDEGAFASDREGVFLGGSLLGRTPMEALSDGLLASHAVERYIKIHRMNQPEEHRDTRLLLDEKRLSPTEPATVSEDGSFTAENAKKEAARCVKCACDACMRECDLMRLYGKTPRRLYEEVYITIRPGTLSRDGTWATRLLSTCSQCGLCKEICPQRIDIGAFMLQGHRAMHEKGAMPWAFHDYWLRDMAFSDTEAAFIAKGPACAEKPKYIFFPGCQMGASEPEYVKKSFAWLLSREPDSALWVHCCGAPAEWAGSEELHRPVIEEIRRQWEEWGRPVFVFGCPTCAKEFKTYLPQIQGCFLYEKMAEAGVRASVSEKAAVFDPCGGRDFPALGEAVRKILSGQALEKLSHEGREALCCSYGGQTYSAAQAYTLKIASERIRENEVPYIAYCVNCRDTFAYQKKPVYHLLDIIFGLHTADRPAPGLTERWENRQKLKAAYMAKEQPAPAWELLIEDKLKAKLSADLILESDMAAVISYCEETGNRLLDTETGHYIGHRKLQHMTYWAEYAPEGNGYRLYKGYAHRMCFEEEDDG